MKERQILFSGPMVRAILEDRKTQTRRVVANQPEKDKVCHEGDYWIWRDRKLDAGYCHTQRRPMERLMEPLCPYGVPGDRLWVRETLKTHGHFGFPLGDRPQVRREDRARIWSYAADNVPDHTGSVPSIHMPRWACRLVLDITAIRVERVQEISEDDAKAEGVEQYVTGPHWDQDRYRPSYRELWDSLNAKRGFGWATNPWVWVVEFKRCNDIGSRPK